LLRENRLNCATVRILDILARVCMVFVRVCMLGFVYWDSSNV
jgi:hypothetical protein